MILKKWAYAALIDEGEGVWFASASSCQAAAPFALPVLSRLAPWFIRAVVPALNCSFDDSTRNSTSVIRESLFVLYAWTPESLTLFRLAEARRTRTDTFYAVQVPFFSSMPASE